MHANGTYRILCDVSSDTVITGPGYDGDACGNGIDGQAKSKQIGVKGFVWLNDFAI